MRKISLALSLFLFMLFIFSFGGQLVRQSTAFAADNNLCIFFLAIICLLQFSILIFICYFLKKSKANETLTNLERDKLALLLDTVDTVILSLDLHGKITLINKRACQILGYEEDELLGRSWFETFIPLEQIETTRNVFNGIISGKVKDCKYCENEIITGHGKRLPFAWYNAIFCDKNGLITGTLSTGQDIAWRKNKEEFMRLAATVFNNTTEGIFVTNAKAEVILINESFTSITGFESKDVIGKKPTFQKSDRQTPAFYTQLWQTLDDKLQWRGEIWNKRNNGETYPTWQNINAVKNEQGNISNYVAIFSDITQLKNSEQKMLHLAHHDNLTGLPNRLLFNANLEQALENAIRHQDKIALMYLDLDKFKLINDTFGHDVGDLLLKKVAVRLDNCLRGQDTIARIGGDEFTMILTDVTKVDDIHVVAKKVISSISEPIFIEDKSLNIGISIGISIFPDDANNSQNLIKAADIAMYHAKSLGKNNYQFITPDLSSHATE